jgi:hypothetical protein
VRGDLLLAQEIVLGAVVVGHGILVEPVWREL